MTAAEAGRFARSRRPAAVALAAALTLSGCSAPAPSTTVETYTLRTASYSYSGYLAPKHVLKLDMAAADSRFADGQRVAKGVSLLRNTERLRDRRRTKEHARARFEERRRTASRALAALSRGSLDVAFDVASTGPSAEVRAIELDIEATLISHRRAGAQYARDLRKLRAQKPVGKTARAELARDIRQLAVDRHWAVAETANQLRGLFGNLRSTAGRLAASTKKALAGLRAAAAWDGTISIDGDAVSLLSTAYTFVYTATEEQVDLLSAQKAPALQIRSTQVASLELASVNYSPSATTNPQSPRYELTYDVVQPGAGFAPRDHGSASLVYSSTQLVVPEAYLGRDGEDYYVVKDGVHVPVQVEKDTTGQFVLANTQLNAGETIQRVEQ